MTIRILALAFLLLPIVAVAQQQQPPASSESQALMITGWIGNLVQENSALRAQNATLATERDALRKQVEDAKPKPEAKQ